MPDTILGTQNKAMNRARKYRKKILALKEHVFLTYGPEKWKMEKETVQVDVYEQESRK